MDDCAAHGPACDSGQAQTLGEGARGAECELLHPVDRMPVERLAQ